MAIWLTSEPPVKTSLVRSLMLLDTWGSSVSKMAQTTLQEGRREKKKKQRSHVVHLRQPDAELTACTPRGLGRVRHAYHKL